MANAELYIVATPLGNLADMVPRAVTTLQTVDLIAAEDTRHSGKLMAHFGITTPMISYHDHSERDQAPVIVQRLRDGQKVALIADAGTPLIADPGFHLVRAARAEGIPVIPIPGPCALIAALSVSGLPTDRFAFEGFLPAKPQQRQARLAALAEDSRTLVFYESPHRILPSLEALATVFGPEREVVLARELTKTFETVLAGTAITVREQLQADPQQQRGEMVLVVSGAPPKPAADAEAERVLDILLAELPTKQAAALAAKITGGKKNALYQLALNRGAD